MFNDSYAEFCDKAEKATEKQRGLKFPRYGQNLRYNSEGIFSYGVRIANLDLKEKSIQRRGYWSPTSSKHYNYAGQILEAAYGFVQKPDAPTGQPIEILTPLVHVEYLSYDDHT